MKKAGIALIALGFYCVLFAFNMDVVVGTTYNIGLMNERQNVVYLSGIIFLAGIVLLGFGFSAKEESMNLKKFGLLCFLSPLLLLIGIGIIATVKNVIEQERRSEKIAIDNEEYEKRMEINKQNQAIAEKQADARIWQENSDKFIDNGDGTMTHKTTGLTWQRCSVGQNWTGKKCEGKGETFEWLAAIKLTSNFAGHSDWRVPTKDELLTLVYCSSPKEWEDASCKSSESPTIVGVAFPNTPRDKFWSSTPHARYNGHVWYVNFLYGNSDNTMNYFITGYVRLVRK
jgi:hypothetical protein